MQRRRRRRRRALGVVLVFSFSVAAVFPVYAFANLLLHRSGAEAEGPKCHCVPENMCQDNDVPISEGGAGLLLDLRLSNTCGNHNEVCCKRILSPDFESDENVTGVCGMQNAIALLDTRITSDSERAKFGEVPWTVAVLMRDAHVIGYKYKCGGSLIHPQVVLTVAHCISQPTNPNNNNWLIRAGELNTRSREEPLPYQDRTVLDVHVHPRFNEATLHYDAALLVLAEPVRLTDNVGVICLPREGLRLDRVKCTACGWGKDRFRKGKHSTVLKTIRLPLVSRDDCERSLRSTRLGRFYNLHGSFLCAGGEPNRDTCKGDGGGPLVCPIPGQSGRYLQLGIVSWGIGCGENDIPGVYVNVASIRGWIDERMVALDFRTNFYTY